MNRIKEKWNKQTEQQKQIWYIFLLLLPFFEPGLISLHGPFMRIFYNAGQVISSLVMFKLFVCELWKERRMSTGLLAMTVMQAWMAVVVLINQGLDKAAFLGIISIMVVSVIIDYFARRNARALLEAFLRLYELLIALNFVTMLLFPKGMYFAPTDVSWMNWLLGYRNMFLFYFVPALALELINKHMTGRGKRFYIMLAICSASMLLSTSKTGLLGMLAFVFLYFTGLYLKKGCNILSVLGVGLAAEIGIVFLKMQNMFAPLFALLGREVTFTGRTEIWERTIKMIRENPLLGYGIQPADVRGRAMRLWEGVKAHNLVLEQQYCFGLIGSLLMIVFVAVFVIKLYKNRKHPYAASLTLGMVSYVLLMLMESQINNVPMYSFFFLACCADMLIAQLPVGASSKKG